MEAIATWVIFIMGIFTGYWLARMQLKGRFEIAAEAAYDRPTRPPRTPLLQTLTAPASHPLPQWYAASTTARPLTLSEQWNLPHRPPIDTEPHLIITKRCPGGYSAKQILGYTTIGRDYTPPQYPGGFDAWKEAQ